MRIIFLGTSHGYPEANRKCSSALVESNGKRIIIDAGCDIASELTNRGMALETVDAIFITHMHGDHVNGLVSFLDICSWKFKTADPVIHLPADPKKVYDGICAWTSVNGVTLRDFKMKEISEGVIYDEAGIKITAYKTMHIAVSYSFLIEAEGKRVLFSGDLSHHPENDFPVAVFEEPLDIAICEAAHFDAKSYLAVFEKTSNLKKLCFNHYSPRFTKSVYEVRDAVDIPVVIACDGTEISL